MFRSVNSSRKCNSILFYLSDDSKNMPSDAARCFVFEGFIDSTRVFQASRGIKISLSPKDVVRLYNTLSNTTSFCITHPLGRIGNAPFLSTFVFKSKEFALQTVQNCHDLTESTLRDLQKALHHATLTASAERIDWDGHHINFNNAEDIDVESLPDIDEEMTGDTTSSAPGYR